MKTLRFFVALITLLVLAGAWIIPVQAHAMLVLSIPAANSSLTSSPPQVELYFSEPVALKLSQLKVMDANGTQVDKGDLHLNPTYFTHLVVSLPTLPIGVYQVVWRVISATDGHQTSGSYQFVVGKVTAELMIPTTQQTTASLPIADMLVKGILYLAASILLGATIFKFLVWNPSVRAARIASEDVPGYERFSKGLVLAALVVFTLANAVSLMVQAGLAKGTLIGWPWQTEFRIIIATTRVGSLGILRFEAALVLAFLFLPRENFWNRWAGLIVCLLLLLTFSLESHAAGSPRPFVPVLADWLHLTAVSVWVGGLFAFMGAMISIRRLAPEPKTLVTSLLIPYFSNLAWVSVGILGLTGIYSAFLEVGRLDALWTTTYGQALIVKLTIALPMLVLGGVHFYFTRPAIRRAATQPGGGPMLVKRFRYLLTVEAALGIVILLWVGAFTSLPPASLTRTSGGTGQYILPNRPAAMLVIGPVQSMLTTVCQVQS